MKKSYRSGKTTHRPVTPFTDNQAPQVGAFLRPYTMRIIFAFVFALLTACGGGGSLYSDGSPDYYDFNYQPELDEPHYALGPGVTLQSRIVWDGEPGAPIETTQHVPMGFVQITDPNTTKNSEGKPIWTHGAGAFVGADGLALELWSRVEGVTVGTFWTQGSGRCMFNTLGTAVGTDYCLDPSPSARGYLTSAPWFQLKKGVPYILTVYLNESAPGWMVLRAKLYEARKFDEVVQVQEGMVGFEKARHFPDQGQQLRAAIARTPGSKGEPVVSYDFLGDLIAWGDTGRKFSAKESEWMKGE